jgi:hypothetical protein
MRRRAEMQTMSSLLDRRRIAPTVFDASGRFVPI